MAGEVVKTRDQRSIWGAQKLKKAADEGLYGHIKLYFENGFITHTETMEREKAPVDMGRPQG